MIYKQHFKKNVVSLQYNNKKQYENPYFIFSPADDRMECRSW